AIAAEIGSEKLGLKISPTVPFNDMEDKNAKEFYPYIIEELNKRNLAYLHVGFEETPEMDIHWHKFLRPLFDGIYFANGGFTKESGEKLLQNDGADAIVYGKLFLANPDLPKRFKLDAELNDWDASTFYTPGEKGYTDYPTLEEAKTAN
ncbi:MAG: alkene reductase, partial [Acidobacteriota bacterium]